VRLAPTFDPTTRTLAAEVQLKNDSGELRPGMYGQGSIVVDVHPHAPVVPVGAVTISDGASYVFVTQAETVQRRAIETGVDGGEWLEVRRGLAAGEEVVVAGIDGLSDGARVRVARGATGATPDAPGVAQQVPAPAAGALPGGGK